MTLNINIIASGSAGNATHISDGSTELLLDCGIPLKKIQQALNYRLSEVSGVLCGHEHLDHARSLPDLQRLGIDTYMSKETADALNLNSHRTKIVKPKVWYKVGTFYFRGFELVHDCYNLGYEFYSTTTKERGVYIVDTAYCKYRFKDLNVILLGVNYEPDKARSDNAVKYRHVLKGHMSLETAEDFIKANKSPALEAVYLLHLSDRNSDEVRFKKEIQKVSGVPVYTNSGGNK